MADASASSPSAAEKAETEKAETSNAKQQTEMEEIIEMLEEERCALEEKHAASVRDLADHEAALRAMREELDGTASKLAVAEENLAIVTASSSAPSTGDADTVMSNASSLASFVTADGDACPAVLQPLLVSPFYIPGSGMSPGLTPRSERESEGEPRASSLAAQLCALTPCFVCSPFLFQT
jgi:hypothetical protein